MTRINYIKQTLESGSLSRNTYFLHYSLSTEKSVKIFSATAGWGQGWKDQLIYKLRVDCLSRTIGGNGCEHWLKRDLRMFEKRRSESHAEACLWFVVTALSVLHCFGLTGDSRGRWRSGFGERRDGSSRCCGCSLVLLRELNCKGGLLLVLSGSG